MKLVQFHIGLSDRKSPYISADIEVDGLGKICIKDCVSKETIEAIEKEVILVLRQKMGKKE